MTRSLEAEKVETVQQINSSLQHNIDYARRQVEEQLKTQFQEEIKRLTDLHKEQLAETKRRQWVGFSKSQYSEVYFSMTVCNGWS